MTGKNRELVNMLNIRENITSELARVIDFLEIFDKVEYFAGQSYGIEMVKDSQRFMAVMEGNRGGKSEILDRLFWRLEKKSFIRIRSRNPYKVIFRGVEFTFYNL